MFEIYLYRKAKCKKSLHECAFSRSRQESSNKITILTLMSVDISVQVIDVLNGKEQHGEFLLKVSSSLLICRTVNFALTFVCQTIDRANAGVSVKGEEKSFVLINLDI